MVNKTIPVQGVPKCRASINAATYDMVQSSGCINLGCIGMAIE